MNVRRSWFFFLVMLVLAVCGTLLLAEKPVTEDIRILRGDAVVHSWQAVGAGVGKQAAAARMDKGDLVLRYFTLEGAAQSTQRVPMPEELEGGTVTRILPVRDGSGYVGVYGPDGGKLYLYRIADKEEPERLMARDCPGDTFSERTSRTMLSELSYEDGVLSFALRSDRDLELFRCRADSGLEPAGKENCAKKNVLSVLATENGSVLIGGTDALSVLRSGADGTESKLVNNLVRGQSVTHLTQGRGGWYYLDAVRLEVCFLDTAYGASQRMLSLDTAWKGEERNLTSAALTREESVLMLLDGSILTLTDADGTRELTGILQMTQVKACLSLLKYAVYALLAGAVLWLLLCGLRRGYSSLVVFRGGIFVAAALLCFTVLHFAYLQPMLRTSALRENEALVAGVLNAARTSSRLSGGDMASNVSRILEGADSGRNVRVVWADDGEDRWLTADGSLALTAPGFFPALADRARQEYLLSSQAQPVGDASALEDGIFRYAAVEEDRCLSILVEDPYEPDSALVQRPLFVCFAALACLALLILLSVGVDLRRISGKMEHISRGSVPEKLTLHTGDELESMASIVNSVGTSLKAKEEERERMEHSYRRFVPEKVLALLGKQSISDVDKSAFAARRMAVMTVSFTFPESLYTDMNNSRLLFDSVNEVIERTASIVGRKGGTVFHFSYNGFDVVLEESGEAVSTAVAIQQEVLSFNELRAQDRLPTVTLRIALDKGNVMLGIVGDTSQMEPTTISSCLSTVQELIDLCDRLNAGILCTEAIISEQQEFGNRYLGKCVVGDRPVRVYEVFDGDEFHMRRGKAASLGDFSQGVYDLYGGDAVSAKHQFLQLAHDYPADGGVRYYLYLADRLAHDPSLPCVLNIDNTGGGEL